MARRPAGLLVEEWAETAGTKETPESQGLVRTEGWPDPYSVDQFPQLGVFNQMWREFSAALVDIAEHGILEWDAAQDFLHPSHCTGSDGRTYQSVQASTGEDPVTDAANVYWRPLIATPNGNMAAATAAQVEAGASTSLFMAPARFLAGLFKAAPNARWRAAAARYGLVRIGTQAEIDGGSADRVPTGATLQAAIPTGTVVVNSSTSQRGIIRTATQAEGDNGVASSPAMTPALVQRKIDSLVDSAPGTLNTLDELAAALGDDPNLAATLTGLINAISGRVGTLEGLVAESILFESDAGLDISNDTAVNLTDDLSNYSAIFALGVVTATPASVQTHIVSVAAIPATSAERLDVGRVDSHTVGALKLYSTGNRNLQVEGDSGANTLHLIIGIKYDTP